MSRGAGLEDLLTQARITNRLLAAGLRDSMKQKDLVALLASTGASDQEIADVLDTTKGTVAATKARLKKQLSKGSANSGD